MHYIDGTKKNAKENFLVIETIDINISSNSLTPEFMMKQLPQYVSQLRNMKR